MSVADHIKIGSRVIKGSYPYCGATGTIIGFASNTRKTVRVKLDIGETVTCLASRLFPAPEAECAESGNA
jgi:hypothetical protein